MFQLWQNCRVSSLPVNITNVIIHHKGKSEDTLYLQWALYRAIRRATTIDSLSQALVMFMMSMDCLKLSDTMVESLIFHTFLFVLAKLPSCQAYKQTGIPRLGICIQACYNKRKMHNSGWLAQVNCILLARLTLDCQEDLLHGQELPISP